jgi:hypothetical protein
MHLTNCTYSHCIAICKIHWCLATKHMKSFQRIIPDMSCFSHVASWVFMPIWFSRSVISIIGCCSIYRCTHSIMHLDGSHCCWQWSSVSTYVYKSGMLSWVTLKAHRYVSTSKLIFVGIFPAEFRLNFCVQDTLMRICCAMLILVRKRLLAGDFTANIQLLQHYPATNIDHLLHIANRLRGTVAS